MNQLPAELPGGEGITMIDGVGTLGLGLMLLLPSLALTVGALWLAARLAPWFTQERSAPPTVRSFFLDFAADSELTQARMTTMLLAAAIVLAVITPLACVVRFGGFTV